ncbi:hypothetical protein RKE29_00390 [Streptomyces sp. B1866]|uniref:hypothetical protein n=1 Tax=Streptomyces sp. B1866 TaxID=3075431 RepID=UPI00289042D8|nr:hypothetical protein [Streptomyces sp. B1866]MDT3395129.1 hypothetical protein [Streptomyces sp. B1866]
MTNTERTIQRFVNPPERTLRDRLWSVLVAVEDAWCRHVTQRALYRELDRARDSLRRQWADLE